MFPCRLAWRSQAGLLWNVHPAPVHSHWQKALQVSLLSWSSSDGAFLPLLHYLFTHIFGLSLSRYCMSTQAKIVQFAKRSDFYIITAGLFQFCIRKKHHQNETWEHCTNTLMLAVHTHSLCLLGKMFNLSKSFSSLYSVLIPKRVSNHPVEGTALVKDSKLPYKFTRRPAQSDPGQIIHGGLPPSILREPLSLTALPY